MGFARPAMVLRGNCLLGLVLCAFALVSSVPMDPVEHEVLLSVSEAEAASTDLRHARDEQQQQSSSDSDKNEDEAEEEEPEGINTAQCWRVRSLIRSNGPRTGFEWSVTQLDFYTSSSGKGEPLSGEATSSSFKQGTKNTAENAFDGKEDTYWQANGMDSGESIGIKLDTAKQVRSLRIRQLDEQHSIKQAVLEKSINCVAWARVAEFPEMSGSYEKTALLTFDSVDTIPSGVFQIRSRMDINKCVGVTPDQDEEQDIADGIPQKSAVPGNTLVIQECNVDVLPQFWSFDKQGNLVNAAHGLMQVALDDAGAVQAEAALTLGTCTGDECAAMNSGFRYNEGNSDGLFLHSEAVNMVIQPKGGDLSEGVALELAACSDEGKDASIEACGDKTFAQWDVPPMFTIETGKKAINCAPYSHTHPEELKPTPAGSRLIAQQACASNPKCNVYMWADDTTGDDGNKAWLCERLDVVYANNQGYELGFRVRGA